MGRQVNFYMHPEDEAEFVKRRCNECRFLLRRQAVPDLEWLDEIPDAGPDSWQAMIGRPDLGGPTRARPVGGQSYFLVDAFGYELVEFTRSCLSGGELTRGRLWFDPVSTFEGTRKSTEFERWATSLLAWIRRYYSRNEFGEYVARQANEWASKGGHLVGWSPRWGPKRTIRPPRPRRPGVVPGLPGDL